MVYLGRNGREGRSLGISVGRMRRFGVAGTKVERWAGIRRGQKGRNRSRAKRNKRGISGEKFGMAGA